MGLLRGRKERLASLFEQKNFHYQGISCELVEMFEKEVCKQNVPVIRVAATLYAVTFYSRLGYKKSTGVRTNWSFDGYAPLSTDEENIQKEFTLILGVLF